MNQRPFVCGRDVRRVVEGSRRPIEVCARRELPDGEVFDHIIHRHDVENLRHIARIGDDDPGRELDIDVTDALHQRREHDEPRHDRAIRGVVEPAIVVGVVFDARLPEVVEQVRARVAVTA